MPPPLQPRDSLWGVESEQFVPEQFHFLSASYSSVPWWVILPNPGITVESSLQFCCCEISQIEGNANMVGVCQRTTPITISINLNLGQDLAVSSLLGLPQCCGSPAGGDKHKDYWLVLSDDEYISPVSFTITDYTWTNNWGCGECVVI